MGGKAVGPEAWVQLGEDPAFSRLGRSCSYKQFRSAGTQAPGTGRMGLEQAVGGPRNQCSPNQVHLPLGHLWFSGGMWVREV